MTFTLKSYLHKKCDFFLFIFLIVLLLSTSCSISSQKIFYSRDGVNEKALVDLYTKIPSFQDSIIHKFIIELEEPDWRLARKAGYTGEVICQVLIDSNADVEAIYINQTVSPLLDNAVIESVKESKFRTLKEIAGKTGKYSLLIPFNFWVSAQPFKK